MTSSLGGLRGSFEGAGLDKISAGVLPARLGSVRGDASIAGVSAKVVGVVEALLSRGDLEEIEVRCNY